LLKQQKVTEAEIAKQKSAKMFHEMLPRDIGNRINEGDKDITFVLPLATLMFIST
jgi:hypothetical protein